MGLISLICWFGMLQVPFPSLIADPLRRARQQIIERAAHEAMIWARKRISFERDAKWRVTVLSTARPFFLNRECSILGPLEDKLSDTRRETIRDLLDGRRRGWEQGRAQMPERRDVFVRAAPVPSRSLAVVMPKYVNYVLDNDISYNVLNSSLSAGFRSVHIPADHITYAGSNDLPGDLAKLEAELGEHRPSIVVIDGNYIPNGKSLDAAILRRLKSKFGFKIVCIIGDCYNHQPKDFLGYWTQVADLSVIFHRYNRHYSSLANKEAVLVAPTLPFHEPTLRAEQNSGREFDLSYVGSRKSRNRRDFIEAALSRGVHGLVRFHDRRGDAPPTMGEYASILKQSKMVFTNGWIDSGEDIITGRAGEAILAGACLIHEVGSPINEYLVPFVHYVPVANLAQFVSFCQFLAEDDERREYIAQQGRAFWVENYSSKAFWATVNHKLFGGAE